MDAVSNPYAPGAGTRPPALVGRDPQMEDMDVALRRLLRGRDGRSQLLTGLRGVGKTVLLNEFEDIAERVGFAHEHIEITEDGNLPLRLVGAMRVALLRLDSVKRIGVAVKRVLGILRAFSLTLPDGSMIRIDVDAVAGPADTGDLSMDIAGLFVEVGKLARDHDTGVLLTIDEIHYVPLPVYAALIVGLHRANQLGLPITVAGAGLPSLPALTGEAKSYAERMFDFPTIGALKREAADQALIEPATEEGVSWDMEALDLVWDITKGYPYFIQEFGKQAWLAALGPGAVTPEDVHRAVPVATAQLDEGFFAVRTGKLPNNEKRYLRAMAELSPGPVKSSAVAGLLGKTTNQLGPVRDSLIKRALCYSPAWGDIDFTVPLFDEYMRRWMPKLTKSH